eukprot:353299-Chlamydomonas_euryale.AAC.1
MAEDQDRFMDRFMDGTVGTGRTCDKPYLASCVGRLGKKNTQRTQCPKLHHFTLMFDAQCGQADSAKKGQVTLALETQRENHVAKSNYKFANKLDEYKTYTALRVQPWSSV